jgi:hypothetical protein
LSELSLDRTPVTDKLLLPLQSAKQLRTVHLRDTKVTSKAIEALIKARPDLRVFR